MFNKFNQSPSIGNTYLFWFEQLRKKKGLKIFRKVDMLNKAFF